MNGNRMYRHQRSQFWAAIAFSSTALALTSEAHAAGTGVDVQSSRGTGMASSVTAMIDDAAAVYYNPAGIAQGKRVDVIVGDTMIVPSFTFKSATTGNSASTSGVVPPFHAYATAGITDELSAGVGVFSPYGLAAIWPSKWEGRSLATRSTLSTYYINPTVAYRFGPLRIGAGIQIVRATLDLRRSIRFGAEDGSSEFGGGSWGVGGNIGAQFEAVPQYLSFGIHYRSAVKLDFDGSAHFDNIPLPFVATIHDQRVKTSLTQPDTLAFGIASRPIPELVIDLDFVWFDWKKVRSIAINFPDDPTGTLSSTQPKNWKNTVNVHLGGELALAGAWRVRAGALYDPSPSPDQTLTPETPDANRVNLAVGGGYVHKTGLRADLGYQFIVLFDKTSTAPQLPGQYGGFVNVVGISIGYSAPIGRAARATPQPLTEEAVPVTAAPNTPSVAPVPIETSPSLTPALHAEPNTTPSAPPPPEPEPPGNAAQSQPTDLP
jgi:long-chain fatty acid transport protein